MSGRTDRHVDVVFVVYDGIQSLDLVGPHDVFDAANRVLAEIAPERPRYRSSVVSLAGGSITTESGLQFRDHTVQRCPGAVRHAHDPRGPRESCRVERSDPRGCRRRPGRAGRTHRDDLLGRIRRCSRRPAGRTSRRDPLGPGRRARPTFSRHQRRSGADLRPRPAGVVLGWCHRWHRPRPRVGRARPRRRGGADRRALVGDVPATAWRPDPVRCAGLDRTGRTGAGPRGTGSRRQRHRGPTIGSACSPSTWG